MHEPYVSTAEVDDFFILRARAFAAKFQRAMVRDVLNQRNILLIEWQLLFSIARFGTCHLAYVTQNTLIDPAHGSRAASSLEAKGFIERQDDPKNRRRKLISLTPDGLALFKALWPQAQAMRNSVASEFSVDDLAELKRLLARLNEAVESLEDKTKKSSRADRDLVAP